MIKVHRITNDTVDRLEAIYARFSEKAASEYHWDQEPVDFATMKQAVTFGIVKGYWLEETSMPEPVGLMLYRLEEHRAIEINLIYSELDDRKTVLDRFIRLFIADIKDEPGWDVVSYAMLGKQEEFIRTITWYGFKPVGQAILKFDIMDAISLQIMKQQKLEPLGPEYRIDSWQPEYAGETAQSIYEAFSNATDAKWDPRFRSLMGAKRVVGMITGGMMGKHQARCTSVLLKNDVPVGFCFLVQPEMTRGNIPLIGVRPSEKKRGCGNHLLQGMLERCVENMLAGHLAMLSISTTMDTDNIPAIKMYRRMGFREDYNYPHVYLTREQAQAYVPGQWC